jgi:hypothetical protein
MPNPAPDSFPGVGGSYLWDPKAKKLTLTERTQEAENAVTASTSEVPTDAPAEPTPDTAGEN